MKKLAAGLVAAAVVFSATGSAYAELVVARDQEHATIETCPSTGAYVERWNPATALPVNFIADQYMGKGGGLFVGLGYDDGGFWSARSNSMDACDACDPLDLVYTTWSGAETTYAIVTKKERSDLADDPAATRKLLRGRLFALAKSTWPVEKLSQDYTLTTPKHDSEGNIENFTGWFAGVKVGTHEVRFAQLAENVMCWCFGHWKGYALAKP
ncbi:MAG: hypothetical protein U0414_01900 [Polyangiaceae bacterium]